MSSPFDMQSLGNMLSGFQQKVEDIRDQAHTMEAQGQAGGGLVTVVANAKMQLVRVSIKPEALDDRELLEDLVTAAANDALRQAGEVLSARIAELTGGLPIPPGMMGM